MFVFFLTFHCGNSRDMTSLIFQTLHYNLYDMFIKTTIFYQDNYFAFAMGPTLILTENVES